MLTKILRKTRLNRLVFQFLKPFAINNTTLPEITLAQGLLEDFSTDPRNSCYYESTNNLCGDILYDLDIIVPCYNVEKYIRVCLESILKQETKFSYRIIAVDDGSTDCTGNILDEYKNRGEIFVIHQKNQGHSGARNTGLNFVNSQYVMFIDSDDYLPEGAIERMLLCAFQLGADIVQGAYTNIDEQGKQYSFDRQTGGALDSSWKLKGFAWGKVIRSKFFDNIRFPVGYWFEDSMMVQVLYDYVLQTGGILYGVEESVYCYRRNPNGISMTAGMSPKCIDTLYITKQLHKDRQLYVY